MNWSTFKFKMRDLSAKFSSCPNVHTKVLTQLTSIYTHKLTILRIIHIRIIAFLTRKIFYKLIDQNNSCHLLARSTYLILKENRNSTLT